MSVNDHAMTKLEYALQQIALGNPVFPCCWPYRDACGCGRNHTGRNIGKVPLTARGFQDATLDENQAKKWFEKQYPMANISRALRINQFMLDIDIGHDGYQSLAKLENDLDLELQNTRLVTTGSGGQHIEYITPIPIKGNRPLPGYPGIDIKTLGGYVLIPPSVHVCGEQYIVADDRPVAVAHDKLIKLINAEPKQATIPTVEGELIPLGEHDRWLHKRASTYRGQGDTEQTIFEKLRLDLPRLKDTDPADPYTDADLRRIARSVVSHYQPNNETPSESGNKNTSINNAAFLQETVSKADKNGTTSGQLRDRNWGSLSEKFDQLMREARAPADKRDIAETMGVRASDDSFRKLLSRRKDEGKVRAYRGSPYVIEWVNRDYRVTNLSDTTGQTMLSLSLPLDAQMQIKVPQGSVNVIAGTTSGGKTSWMLDLAERNCLIQSRPIYFWFNEMSEAKLRTRIEDFPALVDAQRDGRFFPVKQADFEFGDVQHPEAINIIDYIDRDDNMYLIAQDIKAVHQPLTTGVVFLAIQKKKDQETGFGGVMTMKLANLYISLDVVDQSEHSTRGRATIRKAKDWAGDYNPVGLSCSYHTGGKHGKLIKDGEWSRLER